MVIKIEIVSKIINIGKNSAGIIIEKKYMKVLKLKPKDYIKVIIEKIPVNENNKKKRE